MNVRPDFTLVDLTQNRYKTSKPSLHPCVDFQKTYDSVDRHTHFSTIWELVLDKETNRLIQVTLRNTTAKVKFRGELSESFLIRTGV